MRLSCEAEEGSLSTIFVEFTPDLAPVVALHIERWTAIPMTPFYCPTAWLLDGDAIGRSATFW